MNNSENELSNLSKLHSCPYCGLLLTSKWNLTLHLRLHENNLTYKCAICDRGFNSTTALKRHKETHGGYIFKCDKCPKRYNSSSSLRLHEQNIHQRIGRKFTCKICHEAFKTLTKYHLHKRIHLQDKDSCLFDCLYCSKSFATLEFKTEHERKSHSKKTDRVNDGRKRRRRGRGFLNKRGPRELVFDSKCTICGHFLEAEGDFNNHLLSNHFYKKEDKQYACFHCHYVTPHVSKPCKSLSIRNTHLICQHLTKHSKVRPFKCEQCIYSSVRQSDLEKHVRNMHENANYDCPYCERTCKSGLALGQHLRIHSEQTAIYKCDECNKGFYTETRLNLHKQRHLDEKYLCPYCDKVLGTYFAMKHHKAKHHRNYIVSSAKPKACNNEGKPSIDLNSFFNLNLYECAACGQLSPTVEGASCCKSLY